MNIENTTERPVILNTIHRGVFFGYTTDTSNPKSCILKKCKMAIYWGTTKGLFQLANTGPTSSSIISAEADEVEVRDINFVVSVTPEAEEVWKKA